MRQDVFLPRYWELSSGGEFAVFNVSLRTNGTLIFVGRQSESYESWGWSDEEYTDTVTLSPDLVITNEDSVANSSVGFDGFDGIHRCVPLSSLMVLTVDTVLTTFFSIGPTALTGATVPDGSLVLTVLGKVYAQGHRFLRPPRPATPAVS